MRLPSTFGIACSKTGFTSSELCVSPGETHSAVAAKASPKQAVRTILVIVLPSCFLRAFPLSRRGFKPRAVRVPRTVPPSRQSGVEYDHRVDDVRPCAVAGTWYPESRDALVREVDRYIDAAIASARSSPMPTARP